MHVRAAELVEGHVLVRHGLHDVRAGHEHVRRVAHHRDEVGDRGRVHRAAGARPEDRRQLRHDARGEHVAQEDVGVPAERDHALLDPRAARVVESDHRRAVSHRQVHDLADLRRVRFGQRAAEHREVLREHVDEPAIDVTESRYDTVANDALVVRDELRGPRHHERVELRERPLVEQEVDAFARGQLALRVLLPSPGLTATARGPLAQTAQSFARTHAAEDRARSVRGIGRARCVVRWMPFDATRRPAPAMSLR